MQTFLDYLTRKPDESGIGHGFGFHTFLSAGPLVMILEAALLVLCGCLIAGCFHHRGTVLHRIYLTFSVVPLAWGIGIFTWRMLEIIEVLEHNEQRWIAPLAELTPLSETLSEITAVLLTCAILTGLFLVLSPIVRPRPNPPDGDSAEPQAAV
ncbi:MAG TPA: hypothetical protein VK961_22870 [Chthoniobacter sp.]|nr:hypothetical protein [Chthoniobacter sp.]